MKHIKIKNPITQEFNGTFGTYTQQNVEKQRSYNLPEWKALTEETQHQPPAKRGERRRNQAQVVRGGGGLRGRAAANAAKNNDADEEPEKPREKRKPGRPRRSAGVKDEEESDEEPAAKRSTRTKATPVPAAERGKKRGRGGGAGQAKSVTSRRLNNTAESADYIDEKAFKKFDYHLDDLDYFTPERCAELETHYWKSLAFNQPMYAADMPGSLFDDTVTSWNVAHLENLLDVLGTKVPGVNTAYLYLGMWKATFAWHLEDVDLYSINYIHFGAPKQWYSISQEDARRFEKAMKSAWPQDAKNCDQFLRHKTYLISPDVLQKQYGVKVNKLVHYEGEFVITYPYGYHSGYNLGYNCAESVNFATESWLDYGRIAKKCNCEDDNVWVDVAEIERKMRGEPTPEYYEETDDESDLEDEEDSKLPTPPASVKGKATSKKRKRNVKEEKPKKKKKIRIRIRGPTREPCVMCPNENPWEELLPTDTGKQAHRSCALYTPETFIVNENGTEKVCGVTNIDKARLELKCNFCRSKRGACFQCSGKKCARAFHATCALAAGVQIDAGPVPTFGEDGTEYYEEGFDFRCKMHRPKMQKNVTTEKLENTKSTRDYAKELKPNDVVQAQLIGRDVFAGLVIENRPAEMTVLVDVLPDFDRVELDWKYLCVLDPQESQRPKPSSLAIPMPEGMNKKLVSVSNRQDGVPSQEDVFTDNPDYKWHEFYNSDFPPQGYGINRDRLPKIKVDIDKPDQLYYYLPEKSTEAKCFFTDKVGGKEHVPKSSFLDRVSPPKPTYSYQAQRPSLAAAPSAPRPQPPLSSLHNFPRLPEKPYAYKPRTPAQPNMLAIDTQALANQRNFTAQAGRHPSQGSLPSPPPQLQGHFNDGLKREQSHDDSGSGNATPLRPFSQDHYYSTRVLPAAWHGEYSSFQREVRRQSQGAQTLQRPDLTQDDTPNYKSVSQQISQRKKQGSTPSQQYAPPAPMMDGHSGGHLPQGAPHAYGPSPPAQQPYSLFGAPPTPNHTASYFQPPPGQQAWQENMSKYRQPGYSAFAPPPTYQPLHTTDHQSHADSRQAHRPDIAGGHPQTTFGPMYTPSASSGSGNGDGRRPSTQWTPPSQRPVQTPPQHAVLPEPKPKWPAAVHQTPQEFRQQLQHAPSIASRDGAHLRMMRDKGYTQPMYAQPTYITHQPPTRNSFGQPYDQPAAQHVWTSPKAPTASPISDPNTPGLQHNQQQQGQVQQAPMGTYAPPQWGAPLPKPDIAPMGPQT